MKKAFSLVELMIVVAILGILAAVVVPTFQEHSLLAKEAAAKDNLRILRNAIDLYAVQHNDIPPGYPGNDPSATPTPQRFFVQMVYNRDYLSERTENPFNNKVEIRVFGNDEALPAEPIATDTYGWIYKPATKTIKLNWPGMDSKGVHYFDY